MASKIQLKKSNVTGRIPDPADLDWGEIALNYLDGKLFYKQHGTGTVQVLNTDTDTVTRLRGNLGVTITGVFITQATNPGGQFGCDPTTLSVGDLVTISGTPGAGYIQNYTSPTTYKVSAVVGTSPNVTGFTLTTVDDIALTTSYGYTPNLTYTTGGTYTSGDLTLLAGTNVSIAQSGTDITISANAAAEDPTKLPLTGGTLSSTSDGILTINKSSGSGWGYINFSHEGTRRFYFGLNASFEPELGVDNNATFRILSPAVTINNNQVLHAGNYNSYALPLTGGTLTGSLVISGIENALDVQHNGSSVAWRGRIISRNSDSDIATFLGNYNGKSGVFSHSNALNAWAPLYLNTLGSNGGNIVYLPHANTYTISGDNTTYLILDASNYSSYALPLTGGTVTGLVTFTHDNGSQGWSNIVIDASTAQNGAFIRANRASASTGEVGYAWGTAGANQWINYLPTNSTTLQWYQGTAVVMSLNTAGTLNVSGALLATDLQNGGAQLGNLYIGYAGLYNTVQTTSANDTLWLQYGHAGPIGIGYGGGNTTFYGKATFQSAVDSRPQAPGGILGLDTGDGNFDIWGISREYYPSHATAANAWGIQWNGDNNQVRFIGAGNQRLTIDLDGGSSGLTWEGQTVLHAGNYNSYALPLIGGTLTGETILTAGRLYISAPASTQAYQGTIHIRDAEATGANNSFSGIAFSSAPGADYVIGKNTVNSTGYLQIRNHVGTALWTMANDGSSTQTGTLTGASGTTLSFSGGSGAADSYNYVLAAANDVGNRLVVFVNGSARSDDGGTNSVTIRNDGGTLNLGNSSHVTNLVGSSVVTATAAAGTNTTQIATTQFVQTAIANLVDTAPSTLDTLNELAAALGDDPNFATTVTNSLANKLNLTGGTLTGALTINADDGLKAIYGGTDGQTWYRGWGMESDRGAVYIRGTGNASQTLRIGSNEGSQSWNTVRVDASTFTHNGDTVWTAGNDGSGSGLDADLLDGRDSTDFVWLQKGNSGNFNVDSNAGQHATIRFSQGAWGGTNPNVGNYSHIISFNAAADNRTVQLYMGDVPGAIWWRPNQGGTQHPWERIWTPNNDGSGSGLDADLVDGYDSTDLMAAQARKMWTGIAASGANGRRYTIARVYGTPNHWSNSWQNIKIKLIQESYSSGYLEYSLFGYYGMGNGASWILRLKEADGSATQNFQVTLGPVVAAGWDYAGQPTYYQDVYVEVNYYLDIRVYATTYGHGFQSSNPTDGSAGNYTVFYNSPAVADISYSDAGKSSTYHFDNKIWNAGNDGSGSGLDADLLDGIDSSGYWTKSGGWWGSNFAGSRLQGVSANGGEFVLIQDHPNAGQISVLVDGAYIAGENNGFWMTPGNDWNTRYGFYWNGSQIDFRQGTAPVVFGGFVGIGNSFGSDDGNWGSRLNVGGAPHARIDVLCANDGIVTTMYSHQGQNAGKMGTMSNHRLELMANGSTKAAILANGNVGVNTLTPESLLHINGTASDGQEILRITSDGNLNNAGYHWMTSEMAASEANAHIIHLIGKAESSKNSGYFGFRYQGNSSNDNYITLGGYAADNLMVIKMNGNAGIGTTAPSEKLHVSGTVRVDGTNEGIRVFKDGSASVNSHVYLANAVNSRAYNFQLNADGSALNLYTYNGSSWENKYTFTAAGSVGIGTTNPALGSGGAPGLNIVNNIHTQLRVQSSSSSAGIEFSPSSGNSWEFQATNSNTFILYDRSQSVYRWTIASTGNMSIGYNNDNDNGYKLAVNGSFAATTKSFVIDHPTKPGKKLRYGSLEGPENGVYVRGRLRGTKIELPDYWTKLVDPDSITVQLTPVGRRQDVWVTKIVDNCVHVQGTTQPDCYYFVQAERVDVAKLEVEIE